MSERDVRRVEVLNEVQSGRRTVAAAASVLSISERQAYHLLARYQENGAFGLMHKARGRTSNRSHNPGIRKFAVELVKTYYADFGPTLATEALAERHAIQVGRETLRRWMMADGMWLSRKQRRTFQQPRLRRESYGEPVQIMAASIAGSKIVASVTVLGLPLTSKCRCQVGFEPSSVPAREWSNVVARRRTKGQLQSNTALDAPPLDLNRPF